MYTLSDKLASFCGSVLKLSKNLRCEVRTERPELYILSADLHLLVDLYLN